MKISACIITKDEAKNIETCIKSMQSVVIEVILVDTGSTDNTVEIAKNLGAQVYDLEWDDDFASARNYAISKAKGDWIIFLDADEYLAESDYIEKIIQTAENNSMDSIISTLINVNKDKNKTISTVPIIRIFKNNKDILYKGKIHEILYHRNRKLKRLNAIEKITIYHTGYSNTTINDKNKGERNIRLLLKEISENPKNSTLCFYLSESYLVIRDYKKALYYAKKVNEYNNSDLYIYEKNYANIIRIMNQLNFSIEEVVSVINNAMIQYPNYPDFHFFLADNLEKLNQYPDAIEAYNNGLHSFNTNLGAETTSFSYLDKVYYRLACLYLEVDELNKAVDSFVHCLKAKPYYFDAVRDLTSILTKHESATNIYNLYSKLYDYSCPKDLYLLFKTSLNIANGELSNLYYSSLKQRGIEIRTNEQAYLELLNGEFNKAYEKFINLSRGTKSSNSFESKNEESTYFVKSIVSSVLSEGNSPIPAKNLNEREFPTRKNLFEGQNEVDKNILTLAVFKELIKLGEYSIVKDKFHDIKEEGLLLEVAKELLKSNEYSTSLEFFDSYLRENEEIDSTILGSILYLMGYALYKEGNYTLSYQFMLDAQELNTKDFRIYWLSVENCRKLNNTEQLEFITEKAMVHFPGSNFLKQSLREIGKTENEINNLVVKSEVKEANRASEKSLSKVTLYNLNENSNSPEEQMNNLEMRKTDEAYKRSTAPIFIGGAGRSGTTLLRVMLNAHPNLCSGPEFKLMPDIINLYNKMNSQGFESILKSYHLDNQYLKETYAKFISDLFNNFLLDNHANRIVEKTPHNVLMMKEVSQIFPEAKFIHVVRDGRDVASSLTDMKWTDFEGNPIWYVKNINNASEYWMKVVSQGLKDAQDPSMNGKVLLVSYEDLIDDPKSVMEKVLNFIDEPWSDLVLEHEKVSRVNEPIESSTEQVSKKIYKSSKKRWREKFTEEDKGTFKQIAGEMLVHLGYEDNSNW
ncbi:sulfotransferase [Halobacillus salinus]|uniref:sulfotransferase n=1 Tax=Halobacillus salinus TaxID=192814 RepID=UPI0009A69D5D|nr:sulfotransferase [Halobacillus salinus]